MTCDKEGGDGKEVVGEIISDGAFIFTVKHDPRASFCEDEVQEVEAKSRKPIAEQDHNLSDHSFECMFQNGL